MSKAEELFPIDPSVFNDMVTEKREDSYRQYRTYNGLDGISRSIRVDVERGLSDSEDVLELRRKRYGINKLPPPEEVTFWSLLFNALSDKMMILLMASAVMSLVLGLTVPNPHTGEVDYEHGWIEGTAILVSVFIVTSVTSINDYKKEQKFKELSSSGDPTMVAVIRNGRKIDISAEELLVGDIAHIEGGMEIPADGILVQGVGLRIDESTATGENDDLNKSHESDPFFKSGTNVVEGAATMMVIGIGEHSFAGKITMSLRVEKKDTPLQEKLGELADNIGHLGLLAAILTFGCLAGKELYLTYYGFTVFQVKRYLEMLTTAIAIVVVAVPEGLPLSVTIALAYSMQKMMAENCLVRHLAACETMGGATNICSDKTGTLTQNEMTVTRGWVSGKKFDLNGDPQRDAEALKQVKAEVSKGQLDILLESLAVNSSAEKKLTKGKKELKYHGNKTEQAMLIFLERLELKPMELRAQYDGAARNCYPFTSSKKRMTTCIRREGQSMRVHVKGASEIVLQDCKNILLNGQVRDLDATTRETILDNINDFAKNRLRTIAIAYTDITPTPEEPCPWRASFATEDPNVPLTFVGLLGIEDPLRPEVEGAVARCKSAGVFVRMVTGDNKTTAISIAKKAGIYGVVYTGSARGEIGLAMEGKDFRELKNDDKKLDRILPKLQVLARSSPLDKQVLVGALIERGEVVAVTGDGTNDAPALKMADVGFSMNTGTEVAKKASDVVILDDNFRSIVTAMKWGRNVNENIRKFIQFQCTVNCAAVFIAFVGAVTSGDGESPLRPVQLLWLNLIMDTMAALALATEPPTDSLLNRPPLGKTAAIISRRMWCNIGGQAFYQIGIQLWLLNAGYSWFGADYYSEEHLTIVFNVFVLMQVFNEFNARKLYNEINVFKGLLNAPVFLMIIVVTVGVQYLAIVFGGKFMHTIPLDSDAWTKCIMLSFMPLPLGLFLRMIPITEPIVKKERDVSEEQIDAISKVKKTSLKDASERIVQQLKVAGALSASLRRAHVKSAHITSGTK
jgi:P-type E1-E2 ATPase